jgi:hypothetical protein
MCELWGVVPTLYSYARTDFFSGGAAPWDDGYVYALLGGWYNNARNITVFKCSNDLSSCSQVATGPSVEDFYCCFPRGSMIWFSGMNSSSGGIIGYYDPAANTFTYKYSGDTAYKKYLMIWAYNSEYGKWFISGVGDSGHRAYITTDPLDFTKYVNVYGASLECMYSVGRRYVVRTCQDTSYRIYVYLDQLSDDWSTYTTGSLIYQSSAAGPSGWRKYISCGICGGKVWITDAQYDSTTNTVSFTIYSAPLDNPSSLTSVLTTPGFTAQGETQGHVACIGNKYVMVAVCQSGTDGMLYILDANGNVVWSTSHKYHSEFMNITLGNLIGLPVQNSMATGIEARVILLDETNPYLNVSVSGYAIRVSGAYPNSTVYACRIRSADGQKYSMYQSFDKCISATADASGNATITVDETGKWIVVS